MNLTSLLKSSEAAVEQRPLGEKTKKVGKSRTPWDAGGYSLPYNIRSYASDADDIHYDVATFGRAPYIVSNDHIHSRLLNDDSLASQIVEASREYKVNHGDRNGSISTFSSASSSSPAHSRATSISTNNSHHRAMNSTPDASLLGTSTGPRSLAPLVSRMASSSPVSESRASPSASPILHSLDSSSSTNYAVDQLENGESAHGPSDKLITVEASGPPAAAMSPEKISLPGIQIIESIQGIDMDHLPLERPGSPSDALLIKRSILPSLSVETARPDYKQTYHLAQPPLPNLLRLQNDNMFHKRTVSAPNFARPRAELYPPFRMAKDLSPPRESHPDRLTPSSPVEWQSPDAPSPAVIDSHPPPRLPTATRPKEDADTVIKCMYIPDCDTGSQLRKAISHIFGRNKMCTRLIPQHVWVHYCRKHYQRSRYRNPSEYAKTQCDLVQAQIRHVHEWSEANTKSGRGAILRNWQISLRKREQQRIDELDGAKKRKRRADTLENNESDDNNIEEANPDSNNSTDSGHVPEWLINKCRKGYTTDEVLAIFGLLHEQIVGGDVKLFPDVEILPNIYVKEDEKDTPRGYTNKKSSLASHKRAQSLGGAAQSQASSFLPFPSARSLQVTHPTLMEVDDDADEISASATKKRKTSEGPHYDARASGVPMPAGVYASGFSTYNDSGVQMVNRIPSSHAAYNPASGVQGQLPHRYAFTNIDENHAPSNDYRGSLNRNPELSYGSTPALREVDYSILSSHPPYAQHQTLSQTPHSSVYATRPAGHHEPSRSISPPRSRVSAQHSRSRSDIGSFMRQGEISSLHTLPAEPLHRLPSSGASHELDANRYQPVQAPQSRHLFNELNDMRAAPFPHRHSRHQSSPANRVLGEGSPRSYAHSVRPDLGANPYHRRRASLSPNNGFARSSLHSLPCEEDLGDERALLHFG